MQFRTDVGIEPQRNWLVVSLLW